MRCAYCMFENDADAEFCENCGVALARVCAHCGTPLKPGSRFCKKCGTPVSAPIGPANPTPDDVEQRQRLSRLQQAAPATLRDRLLASSAQLEGQRKPVTIVFTDIVGSTALVVVRRRRQLRVGLPV